MSSSIVQVYTKMLYSQLFQLMHSFILILRPPRIAEQFMAWVYTYLGHYLQ